MGKSVKCPKCGAEYSGDDSLKQILENIEREYKKLEKNLKDLNMVIKF